MNSCHNNINDECGAGSGNRPPSPYSQALADSSYVQACSGGNLLHEGLFTRKKFYKSANDKESVSIPLLYVEADPDEVVRKRIKTVNHSLSRNVNDAYKLGAWFGYNRFLRTAEESHEIQAAIDSGLHNVDMRKFFNVREAELPLLIKHSRPGFFHFSGHGSKEAGLILCASRNAEYNYNCKIDYVSLDSFLNFFSSLDRPMGLIVLAACHTSGWLKKIVDSNCAEVAIGVNGKIPDVEVVRFSMHFYQELMRQEWVRAERDAWVKTIQHIFSFACRKCKGGELRFAIYPEKAAPSKINLPTSRANNVTKKVADNSVKVDLKSANHDGDAILCSDKINEIKKLNKNNVRPFNGISLYE